MLNLFKSLLVNTTNTSTSWISRGWIHFLKSIIFGWWPRHLKPSQTPHGAHIHRSASSRKLYARTCSLDDSFLFFSSRAVAWTRCHGSSGSDGALRDEFAQFGLSVPGLDESEPGRTAEPSASAHYLHHDRWSGLQRHRLPQQRHPHTDTGQAGSGGSEAGELLHPAHLHSVPQSVHHWQVTHSLTRFSPRFATCLWTFTWYFAT